MLSRFGNGGTVLKCREQRGDGQSINIRLRCESRLAYRDPTGCQCTSPDQALRAFEAAARRQSLSRAAGSALPHARRDQSPDQGAGGGAERLIERAGRGIRLTEEGERLAARLRARLPKSRCIARSGASAATRGNCASASRLRSQRWLLPRPGRFIAQHKVIDVDVRSNMALIDFRRDDADVAIRHGLGNWPDVKAELLMSDTFFPRAVRASPRGRRARRTLRGSRCCAPTTSRRGNRGSMPSAS